MIPSSFFFKCISLNALKFVSLSFAGREAKFGYFETSQYIIHMWWRVVIYQDNDCGPNVSNEFPWKEVEEGKEMEQDVVL